MGCDIGQQNNKPILHRKYKTYMVDRQKHKCFALA